MDRISSILISALALLILTSSCERRSQPGSVSGTIETDEAHVASRYGGRVTRLLASEGQTLRTGEVIAELAAPELQARRAAAAAQLAELENGPRKEEIETARKEWEAQTAELAQARADRKRAEELFTKNTVSETEREQAATRAETLARTAEAAKSRLDLLLAGTRSERLEQMRAQIAELDSELAEMKVVSPSNCVLEVLSVKVGDVLAPNREVATLLLAQSLWVRVYVPEPWLGRIQVGEAVKVRTDSDPGSQFTGVVEQIAREAEFTPRNVQTVGERVKQVFSVKVRLGEEGGKLRAGMSVDVTFPNVPL